MQGACDAGTLEGLARAVLGADGHQARLQQQTDKGVRVKPSNPEVAKVNPHHLDLREADLLATEVRKRDICDLVLAGHFYGFCEGRDGGRNSGRA